MKRRDFLKTVTASSLIPVLPNIENKVININTKYNLGVVGIREFLESKDYIGLSKNEFMFYKLLHFLKKFYLSSHISTYKKLFTSFFSMRLNS